MIYKVRKDCRRLLALTVISILLIGIATSFSSCLTKKQWQNRYPCIADTITKTKVLVKDSIIHDIVKVYVPADSAAIKALVICDSKGNAQLKDTTVKGKGNSSIRLSIKNGVLKADCKCDTESIKKAITDTLKIRTITRTQEVLKNAPEKDISGLVSWKWILWCLGTGFILGFIIKWKVF